MMNIKVKLHLEIMAVPVVLFIMFSVCLFTVRLSSETHQAVATGSRSEETKQLLIQQEIKPLQKEIPKNLLTPAQYRTITEYLKNEEKRCLKEIRLNKEQNYCPCMPPHLKGRIEVDTTDNVPWLDIQNSVGREVLAGGEWQPPDCVAHTRLAIIIPCRDRESHLRVMLRHLIPILQRQLVHFRIFVVEQNSPAIFNKAAMMNIGFMQAERMFPQMNCVMFHDVDHMMEDDRALMNCGPQPHHYAFALANWNYTIIYGGLFGGVVSMKPDAFRRLNGYPINYFGWGGEDDDMGSRVRHFYRVYRPPAEVCRYRTLRHERDSSNPENWNRVGMLSKQYERYAKNSSLDGMTDICYNLNDLQLRPLYTWVHADLNVTGLLYPQHAASQYRRVPGVCTAHNGETGKEVSMTTCRYLCDVQRGHPCVAFSYFRHKSASASSSASDAMSCLLFQTVCRPTVQLNDVIQGYTYFKKSRVRKSRSA